MMKKADRFKSRQSPDKRRENIRSERQISSETAPKILFSFKDFDNQQIPPGQDYSDWQNDKLLAYMLEEFGHMCEWTIQEAQQHKKLTIYGHWPPKSVCEFRQPRHIAEDVKWAVIRSVGGQKARVVGHVIGNVFYVVFLDKNHVFWKSQK